MLKSCKFSGNSREHSKNRLQVHGRLGVNLTGNSYTPLRKMFYEEYFKIAYIFSFDKNVFDKEYFLHPMRSWG